MGSTKMKGLLKGLRQISQIFDDEKEAEMKIGFPTDVKHVAHIGWDGPSVDSPSWMKEFKGPNPFQSQPLSASGAPTKEDSEIKWVSEDSCRKSLRIRNAAATNASEMPRPARRNSDGSSASESQNREPSNKTRHSRKNMVDGSKPSKQPKDSSLGSEESSLQNPPDAPKKTRRKKSKDGVKDSEKSGSKRSSRSKAKGPIEYTSQCSDPGPGGEFVPEPAKVGLC